MFAKRPKRGEDDDDLLRFQEEFLKNAGGAPSAKVSKVGTAGERNIAKSVDFDVQGSDQVDDTPGNQGEMSSMGVTPQPTQGEQPMEVSTSVMLSKVVENSNVSAFLRSVSPPAPLEQGFPEVPKLSHELLTGATTKSAKPKKMSLFMQQMAANNRKSAVSHPSSQSAGTSQLGNQSAGALYTYNNGSPSARSDTSQANDVHDMLTEISKENEEKLSQMSKEEILSEQQQLSTMFDPSLLEMLRNRKSRQPNSAAQSSLQAGAAQTAPHKPEGNITAPAIHKTEVQKNVIEPIKSSDLPFQPDDKWLHMDQLEHEKLRWLKPLDEHNKKRKEGKEKLSARFNFNGEVINPEESIGTQSALHHHGDEPEAAGYTLEELYILVRSLNTSQKVLALSTLANVMRKAKCGHYIYLLNNSIINSLLQADIVLLLRYALDEKSDLVLAAAVNAWHCLLCDHNDMLVLEALNCSTSGHVLPQLSAIDVSPPTTEEEIIEREEEQYIEILKRDVISGLLLMDFLPRLRYILEVVRPQQRVCSQILDILCRMMMTSSEISYKISRTPRLLTTIFTEFIPMSFSPVTEISECAHGRPLVEAMRSIRYLCVSGRNMASELIARHNLMERIMRYTCSTDPSEFGVIYSPLMVETFLTWRTLVLYGLALEHYTILRPSLLLRLQEERDKSILSSLVCLLNSFLSAAGSTSSSDVPSKSVRFSDTSSEGRVVGPSTALDWTQVSGLIDSVYGLAVRNMNFFLDTYSDEYSSYDLSPLVSTLDFVHVYLTHARVQPVHVECSVSPQAILRDTVQMYSRLLRSTSFTKLLLNIRQSSILLNDLGYLTSESSNSLPFLHSVAKLANMEVPDEGYEKHHRPQAIQLFICLHSLLRLLSVTLKLSPTEIQPICVNLIEHKEVMTYIRQISQSALSNNSTNYFATVECSLLAEICQLGSAIPISRSREIHRLSLALVPKCTSSNLAELQTLFSHVVFSQSLFRSYDIGSTESSVTDHVTQECMTSLPSISNTYTSLVLPMGEQLQHSRNVANRNTERTSKMLMRHDRADLLPLDWPYMPIMHLYQTSSSRDSESQLPPDTCQLIKNSLQFIHLLENLLPEVIRSIPTHAKVTRVMCAFLLDNDLFLEPDMQRLLSSLLRSYSLHVERLDFSQPIPGLHSFTDLYMAFLDHFEATSFGDRVFSQYVVLPMMQHQLVEYRKLVWSEHALTLRSVLLAPKQLVFDMERLLYPEEVNSIVIMSMSRSLLSGTVTLQRNPLLYIVAVHHVNRYMFTTDGKDLEIKGSLLKAAHYCTVEPLKNHLLFYKEYNSGDTCLADTKEDISDSIVCYTKLPIHRCNLLKSAVGI